MVEDVVSDMPPDCTEKAIGLLPLHFDLHHRGDGVQNPRSNGLERALAGSHSSDPVVCQSPGLPSQVHLERIDANRPTPECTAMNPACPGSMHGAPLLPAWPGRRGGRVRTVLPQSTSVRRAHQAHPTDCSSPRALHNGDSAVGLLAHGVRAQPALSRSRRTFPPRIPA
eukprot:1951994-Amphidinium_carterae.1